MLSVFHYLWCAQTWLLPWFCTAKSNRETDWPQHDPGSCQRSQRQGRRVRAKQRGLILSSEVIPNEQDEAFQVDAARPTDPDILSRRSYPGRPAGKFLGALGNLKMKTV
ncbi:unnamed protein product [Symbiodinium sp. CCMP2592]|nr:unnamed protein product [Symbiodinium sp. CCMP2592]